MFKKIYDLKREVGIDIQSNFVGNENLPTTFMNIGSKSQGVELVCFTNNIQKQWNYTLTQYKHTY